MTERLHFLSFKALLHFHMGTFSIQVADHFCLSRGNEGKVKGWCQRNSLNSKVWGANKPCCQGTGGRIRLLRQCQNVSGKEPVWRRRRCVYSSVVHLSVICWQKSEMPPLWRQGSRGPGLGSEGVLVAGWDSWPRTPPASLPLVRGQHGLGSPAGGPAASLSDRLRMEGNASSLSGVLLPFSEINRESGQSEAEYLARICICSWLSAASLQTCWQSPVRFCLVSPRVDKMWSLSFNKLSFSFCCRWEREYSELCWWARQHG